jgi:MFS family permease
MPRATILDACAEPERAGRVSPEKPDDLMTAAAQANTTRQPSRDERAFRVAVRTDIPARLDRLPWCRFHVLIVVALGVTWILDGLEVTIVGAIGPVLQDPKTLALSAQQIGAAATSYVVGAVCGALIFGWLTDRSGRRFVFYVTLIVYLTGVLLSATSWSFWSFAAFRAITGLGIGGEYAAINSAIDELIPANYRGRVDLMVNGSFWLGAVAGSGASLVFLDPAVMPVDLGWRFGFAIGGVLGLGILLLRGFVPESPRWLVTHGWKGQADAAMDDIEQRVRADTGVDLSSTRDYLEVYARKSFGLGLILSAMMRKYRERSLLALALLTAQAFLFNAVFFSYGLVLTTFHGVSEHSTGLYLLPLAASNFFGPVLLAPLFDTVGRRKMIVFTYTTAGLLLLATAILLGFDVFSAWTQTMAWMVIFFFASAAASSAYLTVSEIFPLEARALAIAVFYALGTAIGGATGPLLFGYLIVSGALAAVAGGYAVAAVLMLVAAGAELRFGIDAERRPLESIAEPLSTA